MNPPLLSHKRKQDRLLAFFKDQKLVDCTFKIDSQEIKAHKLILACSSPVFETMFYGHLASDEIVLKDIRVEQFSQMLEFIYTETVHLVSIPNAWSMFYVAKKYILDDLAEVCLDYVSRNLTMSTLVLSYEYSELYNLEKMKELCLVDIIEGINGVFGTDYHMKPSTLRAILSEDLVMTKIDLLCRVINWAVSECDFRMTDSSPENIVEVLKEEDLLKYISKKWLHLNCEYCGEGVVICQCVDQKVHKTLLYLEDKEWVENTREVRCHKLMPVICKSRKVYKIARRLDLQDSEEFLSSISVNTDMVVSGIFLCTEMHNYCSPVEEEQYLGSITVRFCEQGSEKNITKPTILKTEFPYNSQVFVPLRYPVTLSRDKIFNIRISYKNFNSKNVSSIVCSYMSSELVDVKRGYSIMYFYEFYGTIIRGVAYYPV